MFARRVRQAGPAGREVLLVGVLGNGSMQETEWLKRCAYRHIWGRRNELTIGKFGEPAKHVTYDEWFGLKFGEPLRAYHARLKREGGDE